MCTSAHVLRSQKLHLMLLFLSTLSCCGVRIWLLRLEWGQQSADFEEESFCSYSPVICPAKKWIPSTISNGKFSFHFLDWVYFWSWITRAGMNNINKCLQNVNQFEKFKLNALILKYLPNIIIFNLKPINSFTTAAP